MNRRQYTLTVVLALIAALLRGVEIHSILDGKASVALFDEKSDVLWSAP